jgi:hypothetical protein|eukprot:COSAG01_NODE_1482_length_10160_cov_12.513567_1_plen_72_part_00
MEQLDHLVGIWIMVALLPPLLLSVLLLRTAGVRTGELMDSSRLARRSAASCVVSTYLVCRALLLCFGAECD